MGKTCNDIKLYVTSYHEEITGSNTIIRIIWPNGRRINFAIDCGLFQEASWTQYNNVILPYEAEDIDFAIATHAHVDHIGRLPFFVKCGFSGKIYSSFETAVLFPIMINDAFSHMESDYKQNMLFWKMAVQKRKPRNKGGKKDKPRKENKKEKRARKKTEHARELEKGRFSSKDINNDKPCMLYDKTDIASTLRQLEYKKVNEVFSPCEGVDITFMPNGHIFGAVTVYCHIYDEEHEINFFATADMGMKNRITGIETVVQNDLMKKTNFILAESTYGYEKEPRDPAKERIRHCAILNEYLSKNGTVMYISNSLERPQVVLCDLKELQEHPDTKDVLKGVPIYLDTTLGIECHNKYIKMMGQDFMPKNFHLLTSEDRDSVKAAKGPKIIICTSPRFDKGSFLNYGIEVIENPKYALIFTSYTPPWVSNIIEQDYGYKFEYMRQKGSITKRCQMDQFRCYSAHVSKQEMESFLKGFNNANTILFNHGTTEGKRCYEEYFKTDSIDTKSMTYGKTVVLTHQGIVKTY